MIILELIMLCVIIFGALALWIVIGCLIGAYFAKRACDKAMADRFSNVIIKTADELEIKLNTIEEKIDEKIRQEENDECLK